MLKKEINDTKRWRDVPCSWVGRNNIVKIIILPKAIHRFNAILIKLPLPFFTKLDLKISQFVWKHKRPQRAKEILRQENKLEESTFLPSDYTRKFQSSRQYGTATKTEIQTNGKKTDCPEISPCIYGHLIFDKGGEIIQWRKDNLFNK